MTVRLTTRTVKNQILEKGQGRTVDIHPWLPDALKDSEKQVCLAAVDLGTTTIAAYLLDAQDGHTLAVNSCLNPQSPYGADVINRCEYALGGGEDTLADCVRTSIDRLVQEMAQEASVAPEQIASLCIVGNSCIELCIFKVCQLVVGRHFGEVAYHAGGQHILHLSHHLVGAQVHDGFLTVRNDFEFTAVYHDEIVHRAEIFHADFIALLVVELPFGSNFFVEYVEVFHLREITFDRLYGLCFFCQAFLKILKLRQLLHALRMGRDNGQKDK